MSHEKYLLGKISDFFTLLYFFSFCSHPHLGGKKILEYENAYIHNRLKMVVIYYGDLINPQNQVENVEEWEEGEGDESQLMNYEISSESTSQVSPYRKSKLSELSDSHPKKKKKL